MLQKSLVHYLQQQQRQNFMLGLQHALNVCETHAERHAVRRFGVHGYKAREDDEMQLSYA